jgi:ABC-type nitrate/sulfonate/bicarbonate transport system substrate-binding protein
MPIAKHPSQKVTVIEAQPTFTISRRRTLRIGFVPLNDCAPFVIAHEKGLFANRGLNVSLHRELGWATIRDKIIYRELDAAHALAAMPLAATLGLGSVRTDCLTSFVINLNGNAITLSEKLWKRGVTNGATLRAEINRLRHERLLTFGVVNRFSSHHHLLRKWFRTHNIDETQVRIVVLPPSQMEANLSRGNLDGFCVGEPWNSVAVQSGSGWVVTTSGEIDQNHPEKVLMVRSDFAATHDAEHSALISALAEACAYCDSKANRAEIAAILARPEYVGAPEEAIVAGLNGCFQFGHKKAAALEQFCVFHREGANEPTLARAVWTLDLVRATGVCAEPSALNQQLARKVFRSDIYQRATEAQLSASDHYDHENQLTAA